MDAASVLMANAVMGPRIKAVEDKVDSITSPFQAIGRVDTVADLANVQNPEVGWVYLVGLESDPNKAEYWYTSSYNWEYLGQQITVDATPTQSSTNPVASGGVYTALSGKQDTLTFDSTPTSASTNPVTSGGVFTALADKTDLTVIADTYDSQATYNEGDYYTNNGVLYKIVSGSATAVTVDDELKGKQNVLTIDASPTQSSTNPVQSGGVYTALSGKSAVTISNTGDITIDGQLVRKVLTQVEYDLIVSPDPKTEYLIIPAAQANQGE